MRILYYHLKLLTNLDYLEDKNLFVLTLFPREQTNYKSQDDDMIRHPMQFNI